MGYRRLIALFNLALILTLPAHAWPPTYGAEFTFTNAAILKAQTDGHLVNTDESEAARDRMKDVIQQKCAARKNCKVTQTKNAYGVTTWRITYDDGWWFQIATDPAVVEVQTAPTTLEKFRSIQNRLEEDIFGAAKGVGMAPHARTGGGHIHVGARSALNQDLRLFRNFVVDFANHPELATGIFHNDHYNSPPLAVLTDRQKKAFEKLIADTDAGKVRNISAFVTRLHAEVYDETPSGWYPSCKYQALCVTRLADNSFPAAERTFEIRSIRPQQSPEDFVLEIQLIEARLTYLKNRSADGVPIAEFAKPKSSSETAEAFFRYVTETGLAWEPYEKFVPKDQRALTARLWAQLKATRPVSPDKDVPVAGPVPGPIHAQPALAPGGAARCFDFIRRVLSMKLW